MNGRPVETPALDLVVGAYLHQDWPDECTDEWAALEAFLTREPMRARTLSSEIDGLLRVRLSEADLEEFLGDHGCDYFADPASGGNRAWLTEVSRRARAAATAAQQ
ncbi:contact-dependent growth inhibition system immunity protein [Nocardioides taihuensis]|uniref:Contact-dependent growth inhibition system immunity protein n=1 Tax=Nocardioides taihuensis TaxID=1835606 RepID=A0ABW0BKX9_9ACTN